MVTELHTIAPEVLLTPDAGATKALRGKVAVITGGSRGIGAAIAHELGNQGAHLVLNYVHSSDRAGTLAQELDDEGQSGAVLTVRADVAEEAQANRLMESVWDHFGRLDILVNNAGITRDRTFRKMTSEEWRDVIETNLNGVFYATRAATPYLLEQQEGHVINIGSVIGMSGNVGQANYAASKAALTGLTKSLAWSGHATT